MQLVPGGTASVRLERTSGTDLKSESEKDHFPEAETVARAVQYSFDCKYFKRKPREPDLIIFISVAARAEASGTFYVLGPDPV